MRPETCQGRLQQQHRLAPRGGRAARFLLGAALSLVLAGAALLATAAALLGPGALSLPQALTQRTPGELLRYAQRRLEGHTKLEALALPVLHKLRRYVERPVPLVLPTLGKGQQAQALGAQRYDAQGRPQPQAEAAEVADASPVQVLRDASQIAAALAQAQPGQRFVIAAGHYRIEQTLHTHQGGTALAPIVLSAQRPGEVTLEFTTTEGIVVSQPYWVFENLTLRGVCRNHGRCEHAIHVVAAARATVLRNNRIEDFNAPVKVNGESGQWPDDGLLQFNTIVNSVPRQTEQPVTLVDIVAASRWVVADNFVADFVKAWGNQTSFGVFMKGGGQGGRIERNLIVCTSRDISQPGTRVGLSFGGGGTEPAYCRDGRCIAEHESGVAANNIVAHCNDFGIDVNRASATIAYNTLINTAGIDVRDVPAHARTYGNLLDGTIRQRAGALLDAHDDAVGNLQRWAQAPDELAPWPRHGALTALPVQEGIATDFCGRAAPSTAMPGVLLSPGPAAGCARP